MSPVKLLTQMAVLLAMMAAGYIAYKKKFMNAGTASQMSTLVVQIFNPLLIFTSIASRSTDHIRALTGDTIKLAILLYSFSFVVGLVYCLLRRFDKKTRCYYQLMILLGNVGFMGIPLISAIYGPEYVILLVFYMLAFNFFAYTLGIYLASGLSEEEHKFNCKKVVNPGLICSVQAVVIFAFDIEIPTPVADFCGYMGRVCIPVSMMLIGASFAQVDIRRLLSKGETYIFLLVRMIAIPVVGVLIFRHLPVRKEALEIFFILLSMPVASMTGMMAEEYAHKGNDVNEIVALSTIISVVTIPLVSLLYA